MFDGCTPQTARGETRRSARGEAPITCKWGLALRLHRLDVVRCERLAFSISHLEFWLPSPRRVADTSQVAEGSPEERLLLPHLSLLLRQRNLRPPHAPPQPSAANNVWEPDRRCSGSTFRGGDTARLYTTMGLGNWARNEWSDAKEAAREIWQFVRTHNWKQSARSSLQRKYWSQFSGRLAINPDEPILTRGSACSLVGRRHHLRRRRRPSRHLPRPDCRKV